ncbi:GSCFA domain-containing protein [Frateuria edaphi]|uniref:GSCFA domain-containing protein n=1 Tax=Frateuria edaphi TaxID=2898793 RepID=UPI001E481131|nr:GSCFA domain-containing protein [Frateuria edaphi]UGB47492.1 GSCFA domain-containing protein [Frateuria edaphi]
MSNPYKNLENYRFWRRAVAGVERFRFDPVVNTRFRIGPTQRVATAGSCFAQHISNQLAKVGFNYYVTERGEDLEESCRKAENYGVFSARYGNIYTSRQLVQLFEECIGKRPSAGHAWQRDDGRYVDALRPQISPEGFASPEEVLSARAQHLAKVREMFESCDIFVFTLGLTETWRSRTDGTVYPLAPGVAGGSFDPSVHEFVNLDIHDVTGDMERFLTGLKEINPGVKVVLTVSPVPLIATYEDRNVLVSTTYSKSVLRVAADMLYRKFPEWVEYFPSFEIITGNYNNSAYYEADYRGINAIGVDHAMRCFLKHYTGQRSGTESGSVASAHGPVDVDIVCDEEAIDRVRI